MKYSRYNVCAQVSEHVYVLYNLLSEAMVQLDQDQNDYDFFTNCLSPACREDPRRKLLYDQGFLIDDDYDEIDFLRFANKKYSFMTDALQLTIAPTMDCNCKCVYCFETPHPGSMTTETMDAVFDFVKKQLESVGYRHLHIDWFGGEPMLCWNIIRQLSERLIAYAKEAGISYSAGLITNGTILNTTLVREMEAANITSIQITLDGDRETHDRRRMFRDDRGTFDRIVNNLRHFAGSPIAVNVRVNIDRRNIRALDDVKAAVMEANPGCGVYPAMVEDFTSTASDADHLMDSSEFSSQVKAQFLLKETAQEELPARFISCQAQKHNSFGIDERGYLYKCWNELGMPERSFGTVFDYPERVTAKNLVNYVGKDYFDNPECLDCKVLPICMGGCAKLRREKQSLPCIAEKYCLNEYVINIWKNKRNRKEEHNGADQ